jgi:hypothetical protein
VKTEELDTVRAIRDELAAAFDAHSLTYDQARVMNAHRMINSLAEKAKARKGKAQTP